MAEDRGVIQPYMFDPDSERDQEDIKRIYLHKHNDCGTGWQKGNAVSKQRMAHWIVDAITLAYQAQGVPCPLKVLLVLLKWSRSERNFRAAVQHDKSDQENNIQILPELCTSSLPWTPNWPHTRK
ncbi:hypothetical protein QQF64_035993 [Cirrhinus molitorella]|uniref:Uncharacterized protein n=1 Tax=Cirrhinus molitorella TaxID=172907 RepID=A0ABR3NIC0_9TELE